MATSQNRSQGKSRSNMARKPTAQEGANKTADKREMAREIHTHNYTSRADHNGK